MYGVTLTPLNVIKEAVNKRGCRNFEFIHNNFNTITLPELIFQTETYLDNYANSDNKSKLFEMQPKVHSRIPVDELVKTEKFLVNSRDEEIQVQIYAKRQLIIDLNSDGLPIE